jgi:hypothetical protein
MSDLLRQFVRSIVLEMKNAHVPNQLVNSPKGGEEDKDKDKEEVDEMSVAANVAGVTLPLGMKTPGKKKKPGWT